MFTQYLLNLQRRHLMSAGFQDVHVRPAKNAIHTAFDHRSVASAKPAVAEGIACRFGLAPVLRENVRTADFDFAGRSGRNRIRIVSHELNLYAPQRYTEAARITPAPQRVGQGNTDLRHAVQLTQSVAANFSTSCQ